MKARFAACAAWMIAGSAALAQNGALTDAVQRQIASHKFGAARVGVCVRDVETGAVLADVHASDPFTPASNMKLLTSGAALLVLGPDFRYRTEFNLVGEQLVAVGDGDPALADPEIMDRMSPRLTVDDVLAAVTGAVTKAGVAELREVIADDRVFDREFVHPTWPEDNLDKGYSAEIAGLNFHANVLEFFPRPGAQGPGSPPSFTMEPQAPWMGIENRARTIGDGKNAVWLSRQPGTNVFTMRGEVRSAVQAGVEITLHNPPEFFASVLAYELSRAGVRVGGEGPPQAAGRIARDDERFEGARTLAVISTPIAEALKRCNTDSANLYAECFMKRMGHAVTHEPGSWSNGAAVLRMVLAQKLGASASAAVTIADGSGLSRDNAVSPGVLSKWLEIIAKDDAARDVFTASLATPGEGTLKRRFNGPKLHNELHAKSGFINGVRTLSGYLVDPGTGRRLSFSVMVNDIKSDVQTVSALQLHEEVVRLADDWLDRRTASKEKGAGG